MSAFLRGFASIMEIWPAPRRPRETMAEASRKLWEARRKAAMRGFAPAQTYDWPIRPQEWRWPRQDGTEDL